MPSYTHTHTHLAYSFFKTLKEKISSLLGWVRKFSIPSLIDAVYYPFLFYFFFKNFSSHLLMLFVMWRGATVWKLLKAAHQKSTESWTTHGGWILTKGRYLKMFWKCWTISGPQQCKQKQKKKKVWFLTEKKNK